MTADTTKGGRTGDPAAAAAGGDGPELARLRDGVLHLLRRELRDAALADDLCNEAFRIVIERLRRQPLDDPSLLPSYLAQTARNLAVAHRRKEERQRTMTGHQATMEAIGVPALDPAVILQAHSHAVAVRRLLAELPQLRDRELLVRVYLYEQDKDQVCREFGIDDANYKSVIHRARSRFRELLDRRFSRTDL